jgi:hypothetical protein
MPQISRFFGIVVTMFYNDHPPPHFHARYGEHQVLIGIEDLAILHGSLPPRAFGLVTEWAALHKAELLENWDLARAQAPLKNIEPLE